MYNTLFLMVQGQAKLDEVCNSARFLSWRFLTLGDLMTCVVSHKTFLKLERSHKVLACTCSYTRSRLLSLYQGERPAHKRIHPLLQEPNTLLLRILEEKSAGMSKFCVL